MTWTAWPAPIVLDALERERRERARRLIQELLEDWKRDQANLARAVFGLKGDGQ